MYCVIHIFVFGNLLSQTYPSTAVDHVNVSQFNHTWNEAANYCEDGLTFSGGKEIFNYCRSDSCQTVNANDVLPNVKKKPQFLCINGYVVRSPVMEYYECLEIGNVNTANALAHQKNLTHNGVQKCSLFCQQDGKLKNNDFILQQNETCYCLSANTYKQWNDLIDEIHTKSTEDCDIQCDDDKFDRCGGKTDLFSAYKLKKLPISAEIDGNCFYTPGSGKQVIVADGRRTIKVKCYELILNWYDARKECNRTGRYIQRLNNKCDNNEGFTADKLWHNKFMKERIIWNTSIVTDMNRTQGYSCLAMKLIEDSYYILKAQNCNNKYYSLCQKDVSGTDNVSKNTEQTTDDLKGTDNVSKNTEQTTEDLKVSMYAGTAVTLTILPVAVVVLPVCIRRHRTKVVVTEPAAIGNSDGEYENVQENVNTDYHTLNLLLVGETNDYSTLQPNVPDYIEIR